MNDKTIHIELDNNINAVTPVINQIEDWLKPYFAKEKVPKMILGISEIIFNGIEHGNLEISYADKTEYLNKELYYSELEKRSALPKYKNRKVTVTYMCKDNTVKFIVKDDGNGFNWKQLPSIEDNLYESHGRGISITRYCFDKVDFNEKGNEVTLLKKIDPPNA